MDKWCDISMPVEQSKRSCTFIRYIHLSFNCLFYVSFVNCLVGCWVIFNRKYDRYVFRIKKLILYNKCYVFPSVMERGIMAQFRFHASLNQHTEAC